MGEIKTYPAMENKRDRKALELNVGRGEREDRELSWKEGRARKATRSGGGEQSGKRCARG